MTDAMSRADVEQLLKLGYNGEGIRRWWERKRKQLEGRSPNEAWEAGEHQRVYDLAYGLTESMAT